MTVRLDTKPTLVVKEPPIDAELSDFRENLCFNDENGYKFKMTTASINYNFKIATENNYCSTTISSSSSSTTTTTQPLLPPATNTCDCISNYQFFIFKINLFIAVGIKKQRKNKNK